jgi:hypothetical protein
LYGISPKETNFLVFGKRIRFEERKNKNNTKEQNSYIVPKAGLQTTKPVVRTKNGKKCVKRNKCVKCKRTLIHTSEAIVNLEYSIDSGAHH